MANPRLQQIIEALTAAKASLPDDHLIIDKLESALSLARSMQDSDAEGKQPLTEEQALAAVRAATDPVCEEGDEHWGEHSLNMVWFRSIGLPLVRAVERAHGITAHPAAPAEGEKHGS